MLKEAQQEKARLMENRVSPRSWTLDQFTDYESVSLIIRYFLQ